MQLLAKASEHASEEGTSSVVPRRVNHKNDSYL